ncbi:MAG: hypothetical protein HC915_02550 [Anaerolineae bacterium]|nr:hypothetical protein [Anaerolineae bacterium]
MQTLYVHLSGLDAAIVEVDEMPKPTDVIVVGRNPRRRDGKPLTFILDEVNTVIFPMHMVTFIEVMPTGEEEEIETFIRE